MTTTYTNPDQSLGFLLNQAAVAWRRNLGKTLRPVDLTLVQFFLLGSISRLGTQNPDGPSQRDVAEHTTLDINVVSQVVRSLEQRQFVLRTRDGQDGRVFHLSLTPAGRDSLKAAIRAVHDVDSRFFEAVSDNAHLADELRRLSD